jgi:putative transposase
MALIWAGRKLVPPHLRGWRAHRRLVREQRDALSKNELRRWRRATAVLHCLDGFNTVQIAEKLGVTNSAVCKWLAAYVQRGFDGIRPRVSAGPKMRLSPQQLEELGHAIDAGPQAAGFPSGIWTALMITEFIRERFGVAYNWKYVPELLHRIGFSVQRPRKRLSRANLEAQDYWIRVRLPEIKKRPLSSTV